MSAEIINDDPLAGIFASMNVGGEKETKKPNDKKKRTPVDVTYEGYTIRQISPNVGERKSWGYCSSNPLPFDSAKLYSMGNAHKLRIGKDAMAVYRELSADQQSLIDRVVAMKNATESNNDAIWEPFDIRRVKKDVPKGLLRVERTVVALELIVKRKDKSSGSTSDRPTGTTTNPHKISGQVLDLNVPLEDFIKQVGGKSKNSNKTSNKQKEKKPVDILDGLNLDDILGEGKQQQHNQQQPPPPPQHNHHQQQQGNHTEPPGNPDPRMYFWNGNFFEEKPPEMLREEHVTRQREQEHLAQLRQEDYLRRRQQEDMLREQAVRDQHLRNQQVLQDQQFEIERRQAIINQQRYNPRAGGPPLAPMPPRTTANPFTPYDARTGQFSVLDQGEALEYVNRRHSRSRSRHRSASRHRSRHGYPPSMGSSEEDSWYEETPPSSPPRSVGSLHRRKIRGVRYQGEERPIGYRVVPVRRPSIIYDDYPRQRRLTDLPEGLQDAEFDRPRRNRRHSNYDILDLGRRTRYADAWQ